MIKDSINLNVKNLRWINKNCNTVKYIVGKRIIQKTEYETYFGVTFIADGPFTQFTDLTPRTKYAEPGFHTQEAHLEQK